MNAFRTPGARKKLGPLVPEGCPLFKIPDAPQLAQSPVWKEKRSSSGIKPGTRGKGALLSQPFHASCMAVSKSLSVKGRRAQIISQNFSLETNCESASYRIELSSR